MALRVICRRPVVRITLPGSAIVLFAELYKMPALIRQYEDRQRSVQLYNDLLAKHSAEFGRPPIPRCYLDPETATEQERQIREKLRAIGPEEVIWIGQDPNPSSAAQRTTR